MRLILSNVRISNIIPVLLPPVRFLYTLSFPLVRFLYFPPVRWSDFCIPLPYACQIFVYPLPLVRYLYTLYRPLVRFLNTSSPVRSSNYYVYPILSTRQIYNCLSSPPPPPLRSARQISIYLPSPFACQNSIYPPYPHLLRSLDFYIPLPPLFAGEFYKNHVYNVRIGLLIISLGFE